MSTAPTTAPRAWPVPPSRALLLRRGACSGLKALGLFFFRFGPCPVCITASVGYGTYQALRRRKR